MSFDMSLNYLAISELEYEAPLTRNLLERVPDASLSWQPHDKSMSLGRLVAHIVEVPTWIGEILNMDEMDITAGDYKPPVATSAKEAVAQFDDNVARALSLLKEQSDEHLKKHWRLRKGDKVIFDIPRIAVIRFTVLNHLVHHRGQLTVYLRMQNVALPSVYGPTADEPEV